MTRVIVLVLDSLGIGAAPDTAHFGLLPFADGTTFLTASQGEP